MTFESEEDRLSVGILSVDQRSSIIQFFLQSEFVLLYQVVFVVLDAGQRQDAMLHVVTHLHLVDVDPLLFVLLDVLVLDEVVQGLLPLLMDLHRVRVLSLRKIDFWLDNMEEAHWVSFRHKLGLLRVEGIVRRREYLAYDLLVSQVAFEASYFNHILTYFVCVFSIIFDFQIQ